MIRPWILAKKGHNHLEIVVKTIMLLLLNLIIYYIKLNQLKTKSEGM